MKYMRFPFYLLGIGILITLALSCNIDSNYDTLLCKEGEKRIGAVCGRNGIWIEDNSNACKTKLLHNECNIFRPDRNSGNGYCGVIKKFTSYECTQSTGIGINPKKMDFDNIDCGPCPKAFTCNNLNRCVKK